MILIDTNILLYAVNRDDPRNQLATRMLESIVNKGGSWALSWSIVYEFMRVATHPKIFHAPLETDVAWRLAWGVVTHPDCHLLTETAEHADATARCLQEAPRIRGNMVHDLHVAVLMREHGIIRILTEDRDYRLFPWIEVVPLPEA